MQKRTRQVIKKQVVDMIVKQYGIVDVKKRDNWNGYQVYEPIHHQKGAIIGYPFVVLVKGDEIRWSTIDESFDLLCR